MSGAEQPEQEATLQQVKDSLASLADHVVPWFYQNMHEYYFKTHSPAEQLRHLQAIITGQVTTDNQSVQLKSPCGTRITYISPGADLDNLIHALEQLKEYKIQTARIYPSFDGSLRLDTFHLASAQPTSTQNHDFTPLAVELEHNRLISSQEKKPFLQFLDCASSDYVEKFEPGRAARHFKLIQDIAGTERVMVQLETEVYPGEDRITLAMNNPPRCGLLLEIMKTLQRMGVNTRRAYADLFAPQDRDSAAIISLYLQCEAQNGLSCSWDRLLQELRMVKWYAPDALEWFAAQRQWPLADVALLQAACDFVHHVLVKRDVYAYTLERIHKVVQDNFDLTEDLLRYFQARFDPAENEREDLLSLREGNVRQGLHDIFDETTRTIFKTLFTFFKSTLRTNAFVPRRLGLAFRLDPRELGALYPDKETPFGVYYFHGPRFSGFHVRYRDIARGGVRLVPTNTQEQYKLESNRLLDEVTGLAWAQQYKNKDIPEGGSKAVLLLKPGGEINLTWRAMIDALLDLIVCTEQELVLPDVIDYLKRREIIYLGPDEHITPEHITWAVNRAKHRGYRYPAAFMSSKPEAGINHKAYGVTSLGVVVFVEEVLKSLGLDPAHTDFTIKMTGGPAGDVASNAMRFLIAGYQEHARILSISDGHGAAYDPAGLDHTELLRLIEAGERAHQFNPERLSDSQAFVIEADTPENIRIRDELHNTVQADVFLPCGGRPETINEQNWHRFLDSRKRPSAKAIVEGANIFLSPVARDHLQAAGVLIVHGSSANKTGVIASSYEILAGLLLDDAAFMEIKTPYIEEVLEILKQRARDEARLLLKEYTWRGGTQPLTDLTVRLSEEINQLGDTIAHSLVSRGGDLNKAPLLRQCLFDYCPPVLVEKHGARLVRELPERHCWALLGAALASRIVYREGLGWLRELSSVRDIFDVATAYLEQEARLTDYLGQLKDSGAANATDMAAILQNMGRKYLTARHLGLDE